MADSLLSDQSSRPKDWPAPTFRARKGTWVRHKFTMLYGQIESVSDGCAVIVWAYPGEARDRIGETCRFIPLGDLQVVPR